VAQCLSNDFGFAAPVILSYPVLNYYYLYLQRRFWDSIGSGSQLLLLEILSAKNSQGRERCWGGCHTGFIYSVHGSFCFVCSLGRTYLLSSSSGALLFLPLFCLFIWGFSVW
jgi:hypothetical protein